MLSVLINTFLGDLNDKKELMSEHSVELDKVKQEKPCDRSDPIGVQYISHDLSRDYMFPPLEPTVLPRCWSYNGRWVLEQSYV